MLSLLRRTACVGICATLGAGESLPWNGQALELVDDARAVPAIRTAEYGISAYPPGTPHLPRHRRLLTSLVALRIRDGADADAVLARHGLHSLPGEPNAGFVLATSEHDEPLLASKAAGTLAADQDVVWASPVLRHPVRLKGIPDDPGFPGQWQLSNPGTVASGAVAGMDLNVLTAWDTVRGAGVNIAVVDEGIDIDHPDLAPTVVPGLQRDLVLGTSDPRPRSASENHGTVVAGLAAARGFNGIGVCGAAPAAGLAPIRLIVGLPSESDMATALTTGVTGTDLVSVSSNSWGADDTGDVFEPVSPTLTAAIVSGSTQGRGGRGIVYVWAAGNGGANHDDTAYDGYQQQRQIISVGAIDAGGHPASYTEAGANLLVCAPGGDAVAYGGLVEAGVASSDRSGSPGYSTDSYIIPGDGLFGTSFSTPLVSGAVALLLQANPALTWRDIQQILVRSSRQISAGDAGWQSNGAGRPFHHRLGYGLVDASAAVASAGSWIPVPAEDSLSRSGVGAGNIPDGSGARTITFDASAAGDLRIEAAVLTITVAHARWSDLVFTLHSPAGTQARIGQRTLDSASGTRTLSVVCRPFWDEAAVGTWSVDVADLVAGSTGSIMSASLTLSGWHPRQIPVVSAASPTLVRAGDASATITLAGTGFANDAAGLSPVSTVAWSRGAASGTASVVSINGGNLVLSLPAAALAGAPGDALSLTCANPAFAGLGGGSAAAFAIALRANLPPAINPTSLSTTTGGSGSVALGTSDPDNDTLSFSASASTLGTVSFSGSTLVFNAGSTVGSESLTITADDGHGGQTQTIATITVLAPPPPAADGGGGGGSGGCGSGMFGAAFVLLLGLRRRRRVAEQA